MDVPPGEAPLEVRRAWVGLELPLCQADSEPRVSTTFGVLSVPKSWWARMTAALFGVTGKVLCYQVDVLESLDVLEETSPDAAAWWRMNAPLLVRPGMRFCFAAEVCTVVDESRPVMIDGV